MSHYFEPDFEKTAYGAALWKLMQGAGKTVGTKALDLGKKFVAPGVAGFRAAKATGKSTTYAAGRAAAEQAKATGKVIGQGVDAVKNSPTAQAAGKRVSDMTSPISTPVGRLGQYTTDVARNVLNVGDDAIAKFRNPTKGRPSGSGWGAGDRLISPTLPNPRSLRNVAVGSGVTYGGASAMGLTGGGSAEDSVYTPVAPGAERPISTPNYTPNGGGFLNGIPKEMQYAAMAGVPLALLGAYMGGGKGLGLGALGLGAMGLGAAGSGYFGDDARRLVGQGASSLMGLFGGNQNGDVMSQIEQLSKLSPEFGVTILMGKNPGLSREEAEQMYQFLTQNRSTISKMMPMVTGAQTPMAKAGALMAISSELDKAARCWKGYEPVPGKKPYTNGSCRPAGSKKKRQKSAQFPPVSLGAYGAAGPQLITSSSGQGPQGGFKYDPTLSLAHKSNLEKTALIGVLGKLGLGAGKALVKNIPRAAAGIASGSRRAVSAAGNAASFAGNQLARGGKVVNQLGNNAAQAAGKAMRHIGDTAAQPDLNTFERGFTHLMGTGANAAGLGGSAMAAGGSLARRVGQGVNLAGQGLQMAGKHTATAVPLAAAGAYGAYQAARPMLPAVNFRSPVADSGESPSFTYNPGRAPRFQMPVTIGGGNASNAAPMVEDDE